MPTREEMKEGRKNLIGLSDEFYDYGTMTRYDFDKIQHALNFAERCKKDGILTYSRECQELKEKINQLIKNGNVYDDGFSWRTKIQNILKSKKENEK